MNIEDPRVRFYLKHREQFAEWFDLRTDAAAAIDEWLVRLASDIELLAADLGDDVQFHAETADEHGYPGMYLVRSWWPLPAPGSPMIGIQWTRRKTLMVSTSAPWLGVRADRRQALGRAIHASVDFQTRRRARKDVSTQWWQSLRYVLADADFPGTADKYRAELLEGIRGAWLAYSLPVDDALKGAASGGRPDAADGQTAGGI